jgi:hypothetical protein
MNRVLQLRPCGRVGSSHMLRRRKRRHFFCCPRADTPPIRTLDVRTTVYRRGVALAVLNHVEVRCSDWRVGSCLTASGCLERMVGFNASPVPRRQDADAHAVSRKSNGGKCPPGETRRTLSVPPSPIAIPPSGEEPHINAGRSWPALTVSKVASILSAAETPIDPAGSASVSRTPFQFPIDGGTHGSRFLSGRVVGRRWQ